MDHHDLLDSAPVRKLIREHGGGDYTGLKRARRRLLAVTREYPDRIVPDSIDIPGVLAAEEHTGLTAAAGWRFAVGVNQVCEAHGLPLLFAPCEHERTRNLYDQRPPSEGRKLKAAGRLCEDCGAVFPRPEDST